MPSSSTIAQAVPRLDVLREVFQRHPDVRAAYAFGSAVSGRHGPESDLDLAVSLRTLDAATSVKLDVLADLVQHGFENVDLVVLETADLVVRYEAIRPNQLIYRAPDYDHGAVYSKILREYLDFLPYLERQREAYKKRIQRGQT